MRKLALAAVVCLAFVVVPAALGAAVFATPKKALYCKVEGKSPVTLVCWRPSNGFTARLTATGKASGGPDSGNKGKLDSKPGRVLQYGKTWARGSLTCTSRKLSLICINGKSHGFALGPARGFHVF